MLAEIMYLIGGVAYIFVLVRKISGQTSEKRMPEKKTLILTVVTIAVSALLNMVIPSLPGLFLGADASDKAMLITGCIGSVILPLIIALTSVFLVNHFLGISQRNLIVMIVLAVICAFRASIYEAKDLLDLMEYTKNLDFQGFSFMEMQQYTPQYIVLVKILTYLPMLVKMLVTLFGSSDDEMLKK